MTGRAVPTGTPATFGLPLHEHAAAEPIARFPENPTSGTPETGRDSKSPARAWNRLVNALRVRILGCKSNPVPPVVQPWCNRPASNPVHLRLRP